MGDYIEELRQKLEDIGYDPDDLDAMDDDEIEEAFDDYNNLREKLEELGHDVEAMTLSEMQEVEGELSSDVESDTSYESDESESSVESPIPKRVPVQTLSPPVVPIRNVLPARVPSVRVSSPSVSASASSVRVASPSTTIASTSSVRISPSVPAIPPRIPSRTPVKVPGTNVKEIQPTLPRAKPATLIRRSDKVPFDSEWTQIDWKELVVNDFIDAVELARLMKIKKGSPTQMARVLKERIDHYEEASISIGEEVNIDIATKLNEILEKGY